MSVWACAPFSQRTELTGRCGAAPRHRECRITKNIPAWNFSWRFDYKRTAKRWLQGENNVKEKRVLVFQILLTERARERDGRRRGWEESKERERERTEGVIPVPQTFVLRVYVSCLCEQAASWPAVSLNYLQPLPCPTHSLLTPPLLSFSPSLSLGSAVGPLFQRHCGGLSSAAVHSLGCPVNGANRVAHNPSYIFHRAF